jgi:hypothetical protein
VVPGYAEGPPALRRGYGRYAAGGRRFSRFLMPAQRLHALVAPAAGLSILVALGACATAPGTAGRALATGAEGFVAAPVISLSEREVLDRSDFCYAAAATAMPAGFAYTHLGAKQFRLGLWELEPAPRLTADVDLGDSEHDVEGLAFSPDGSLVATAARDGSVRIHKRATGKLLALAKADEPLSALAWSPDGRFLVTGGALGMLTVFEAPSLRFGTELRAHRDEVRALGFDRSGLLYSGGWDKAIARHRIATRSTTVSEARVRFDQAGRFRVVTVSVNGSRALRLALDARAAHSSLTVAAARAAGIDPAALESTITARTPSGPALVRVARGQALEIEALRVRAVDLALCDACVPEALDGVIGQDLIERFDVRLDETMGEALFTARSPADATTAELPALEELSRWEYPGFVNDLSVDWQGALLGVAFGERKAERTLEVYRREKAGVVEPLSQGNFAAIVDGSTGAVERRFVVHHGTVSTAGISPDGRTLATGGWDKMLYVFSADASEPLFRAEFGWSVRRARFSPDGRHLAVAAWTPQKPSPDAKSDPAAVVYDVRYAAPALPTQN